MPVELVHLCHATVNLAPPKLLPDTPDGTFLIVDVEDAVLSGERLEARMTGSAAADWMRISSKQVGTLDVRVTLETHDGALVYAAYRGRVDLGQGIGAKPLYSAPLFFTGDPRYEWLNAIQAIAKGVVAADGRLLTYEMFEVR